MEFNNQLSDYLETVQKPNKKLLREIAEKIALIISPFAPHMAEEMWHDLGKETLIVEERWPDYDEEALKEEEITIVVQVNGKVRGRITVPADSSEDQIKEKAVENVKKLVEGKQIVNIFYVPGKLVNIVVK
jgi:leucyl-tRNA synthetase